MSNFIKIISIFYKSIKINYCNTISHTKKKTILYPYGKPHFNKINIMTLEKLDKRMFELYELLKSMGILKYKRDFANACGLPEQNLYNIKMKRNHFTLVHVANICIFYSINANWIIGTESNLFIKPNNGTQTIHKSA